MHNNWATTMRQLVTRSNQEYFQRGISLEMRGADALQGYSIHAVKTPSITLTFTINAQKASAAEKARKEKVLQSTYSNDSALSSPSMGRVLGSTSTGEKTGNRLERSIEIERKRLERAERKKRRDENRKQRLAEAKRMGSDETQGLLE
eukprot:TRINITY_DN1450_c0_g1_i13.p2 TRINITY_DN1450_c0_g1~~TRINITY_DN1450_c0_g1_i13.p2  ORF type:complete len:169 (+),score=44.79 TRINITY_DN1450_c0_g1_i13:66-509(+)